MTESLNQFSWSHFIHPHRTGGEEFGKRERRLAVEGAEVLAGALPVQEDIARADTLLMIDGTPSIPFSAGDAGPNRLRSCI
jgi:hypothetical protein